MKSKIKFSHKIILKLKHNNVWQVNESLAQTRAKREREREKSNATIKVHLVLCLIRWSDVTKYPDN
jgi:hypothetical protein